MNNIEILIKESGKKLKEISEETGIAYPTLSGYNQGIRTPKKENARKLAKYFGVSIAYLLGIETISPITKRKSSKNIQKELSFYDIFEIMKSDNGKSHLDTIEILEEIAKKSLFESPTRERLDEIKQEKIKLNEKLDSLDLEASELRMKLDKEIEERLKLLKK